MSTLARTGKTERAQDSVMCKLLATALRWIRLLVTFTRNLCRYNVAKGDSDGKR